MRRARLLPQEAGPAASHLDLDKNGKAADHECVATPAGDTPDMCSPHGGYRTGTGMGRLTGFDLDGLQALLANARAQGGHQVAGAVRPAGLPRGRIHGPSARRSGEGTGGRTPGRRAPVRRRRPPWHLRVNPRAGAYGSV
ncbi:hypothetical protein [Streptomyces nigrescens]